MSLDVYLSEPREVDVCSLNITHNLASMAREAGIYAALWRPDENGIELAEQLIPLLQDGLGRLESDPERFRKLNPENGWGNYEILVDFTRKYLESCKESPKAKVRVWR